MLIIMKHCVMKFMGFTARHHKFVFKDNIANGKTSYMPYICDLCLSFSDDRLDLYM